MVDPFKVDEVAEATPLIPAATVVLLREHEGELQTLMLRRNEQLRAFAGAWVFPGGRVDETDRQSAKPDEIADARRAAVREAEEETGFQLAPEELTTLSYWEPGAKLKKRFGTWFFLSEAPAGEVQIDHGEIHDYCWLSPRAVLERHQQKEMVLIPPTYVTLHDLAAFQSLSEVLAAYKAHTPQKYLTNFLIRESGFVSLWQEDVAYKDGKIEAPGPRHRLLERENGWEYIKNF